MHVLGHVDNIHGFDRFKLSVRYSSSRVRIVDENAFAARGAGPAFCRELNIASVPRPYDSDWVSSFPNLLEPTNVDKKTSTGVAF